MKMVIKKFGNWIEKNDTFSDEDSVNSPLGRSLKLIKKLKNSSNPESKYLAIEIIKDMGFNITDKTFYEIIERKNIIKIGDEYSEMDTIFLKIG